MTYMYNVFTFMCR